jgi:hypothetical protein
VSTFAAKWCPRHHLVICVIFDKEIELMVLVRSAVPISGSIDDYLQRIFLS